MLFVADDSSDGALLSYDHGPWAAYRGKDDCLTFASGVDVSEAAVIVSLAILEQALRPGVADFWQRAARLRERLRGRNLGDSTDIVRETRDRRSGVGD